VARHNGVMVSVAPEPGSPAPDLVPMLNRGLRRSSPVPLYHQLADLLRTSITDGSVPAGSRLETEVSLAQRLGLSRPTVRQALQELVNEGLLVRRRGVGTLVVHPQVDRPMALSSLYEDLALSGRNPTTELLDMGEGEVGSDITRALGLPDGAPVVTIRRLRSADGEPLALMTNYLPQNRAPEPERLRSDGLYQCLRDQGVQIRVAHQRVGARIATAEEARLLDERPRAALVTMERTAFDEAGAPVELGRHVYRASRYHFETTLVVR